MHAYTRICQGSWYVLPHVVVPDANIRCIPGSVMFLCPRETDGPYATPRRQGASNTLPLFCQKFAHGGLGQVRALSATLGATLVDRGHIGGCHVMAFPRCPGAHRRDGGSCQQLQRAALGGFLRRVKYDSSRMHGKLCTGMTRPPSNVLNVNSMCLHHLSQSPHHS